MNKVTCNDSGHSGVVHLMSTCGKLALVRWDNGQTPMWRNVATLTEIDVTRKDLVEFSCSQILACKTRAAMTLLCRQMDQLVPKYGYEPDSFDELASPVRIAIDRALSYAE